MNSKIRNTQAGFTLIEIAIVLVIIGLLLGGVLQGQQLIENSRVRSATNILNGIAAGQFSYQDRYARLPGDDGPLATLQERGGNWVRITKAGDINGSVDVTLAQTFKGEGEEDIFFQHLRAAGFISGDVAQVGVLALIQNPFGGLVGLTNDNMGGDLPGTKVCMGSVPGSAAIALDTQLDDGNGATGRFRATLGANNTSPTNVVLAAAYNEDQLYTLCYRI